MSTIAAGQRVFASEKSLKRHSVLGFVLGVLLFSAMGYWAYSTEISGAVSARGNVVVDSFAKQIQHQEGGIVRQILVRDGDLVEAGELLAVLDDTAVRSQISALRFQISQFAVREARLVAEINGDDTFAVPDGLGAYATQDDISELTGLEGQVLAVTRGTSEAYVAQLGEQITQLSRQIEGLETQLSAIGRQIALFEDEIATTRQLVDGRLIEASRLNTMERQLAQAEGEEGRIIAAIAEANAAIAERNLQIAQVDQDHLSRALEQLQEVRSGLSEATQQEIAAVDRASRLELRAPQRGVVHQSSVHTVGGVLGAGATAMLIVPVGEDLYLDVRLAPTDIDKVSVGQPVSVRITGYNQRMAPELEAQIMTIAPDLTVDQVTGNPFYSARIALTSDQLAAMPDSIQLIAGMPVEAFIKTADRTVLSYLVQPITDQLAYAMREE
ncbi:HlyD family type I secretion periplasmic adaptor subunit [Pelagibacterium luteolum]|uniref:Membrane fusion protein (MFP) family protein n=1 Tax=Pelagibacterium luteolum TaxID=440168 RepID=A0A1G7S315_9HYPH|nr:HlyD family type I secretion periplasmic adaptor subunit [Pelagibacterium luteolum]SDG17362.1 HlyD family secretion protein [Pelagibacterium luteolum]